MRAAAIHRGRGRGRGRGGGWPAAARPQALARGAYAPGCSDSARRLPRVFAAFGAFAAFAALAACAGAPSPEPPPGTTTPVHVLDAAWVRFEGERRPLEYFLLTLRERVRAAAGEPGRRPAVVVHIPKDAPGVDARWLDTLREELRKAGVQHVALEPG